MKRILLFAVLLVTFASAQAQEKVTIFLTDSTKIKAKLVQITSKAVRYHQSPDKGGMNNTYVVKKRNIVAIEHENGSLETFPIPESTGPIGAGSHLTNWAVNIGGSVSLGNKAETNYNYTPKLAIGIAHQWGYQMSEGTSIWAGGEFQTYNSAGRQNDSGKTYGYNVSYIGIPLSFRVLRIQDKTAWNACLTLSGGMRYYNDNTPIHNDEKPAPVGVAAHITLAVGGDVRLGKTVLEAGPYVDYFTYGTGGNMLGYGIRLTLIH